MREHDSYAFLKSLSDNTYSERELSIFIEKCIKIALFYLNKKHSYVAPVIAKSGLTFEDAAVEVVVRILEKDGKGRYTNLIHSFEKWDPPIKNTGDAEFFINAVTARSVEQYTAALLKENDCEFAKIQNALKYQLKLSSCKIVYYLGVRYIAAENNCEISPPLIDKDGVFSLPNELFKENRKTIPRVLDYLKEETEYFPAVAFNDLVYVIKDRTLRLYQPDGPSESIESEIIIDECINGSLSEIFDKLKETYYDKGKIKKYEMDKLRMVLRDIACDLKSGGIERGLFTYFKPHFKTLTNEEFAERYQNLTEYLIKLFKQIIAAQLRNVSSA